MIFSKEAQKCYCGTEICRGFLGGTKRIQLKSEKKTAAEQEEESERKKKELFEDRDTVRYSRSKYYAQVEMNKIFHRKIVHIFLPILFSICFGCSKEPSH